MASEKAASRKVPLWVWIVGGFLIVGLFGNLLGDGEQEIQAEEVESAQVEAEPVESVEAEEAQPVEAEVIEDEPQPAEAESVEEEAVPEADPAPAPAPAPEPSPTPEASAEATDPRFSSCTKAKAAGYGPYTQGVDEEYGWYQDRDKDGIVCE